VGAAAVVSGAGPAVLVLCPSASDADAVAESVTHITQERREQLGEWQVLIPDVDTDGATDLSTPRP
jgi:homoserine kinase